MNKLLFTIKTFFIAKEDKDFFLYLYKTIGFCPKNLSIYKTCFVHRSASPHTKRNGCNERLEFLGDSILGSITADYLYTQFPDEKEGLLTKRRSLIVNRKNLNQIGNNLRLQKYLAARIPHLKQNDAIGNCLEALVGAIYKDLGYKKTRIFVVDKIIKPFTDFSTLPSEDTNYKSLIIQRCQQEKKRWYFSTELISPDGKIPSFRAEFFVDDEKIAEATGKSKKDAEQLASKKALKSLEDIEVYR